MCNKAEAHEKTYAIDYGKLRDACSIIWISNRYKIDQLEPYLSTIQSDDGEDFHDIYSKDSTETDGQGDFQTLELNNFEAIQGGSDNEFYICFSALVSINLNNIPDFKQALEKAGRRIVARIGFKKDGKKILDEDGEEEILFEMDVDQFTDLQPTL